MQDIKTGQKQYLEIIEEFYEGNPDRIEKYKGRIVQRSSIGILQLVVEEACSDEQKEYYEKDFRDICEKFYRNRELEIDITHNDSSILSILFDRYLYLGGAHGTPLRKSMVVNLNTGEPIKLHEILPVSFSELMDILRNQLYVRYGSGDTEVLEVCYKNIVDLYHEVDEFKFYIRYSALYIYFDVYEISSYSMGYVDLYIMDLQEFLSERCDISECDIVRKQAIFEKIFKPNIR